MGVDLLILWLARSWSWLVLLFTILGAFYLLTNALALTQSSAWDSWRERGHVVSSKAVAVVGQSIIPSSILLVVCFLGVGFIYGLLGTYTGAVHQGSGHMLSQDPSGCANLIYQAIVPEQNDE
jgi:hypothetical protein